MVGGIDMEKYQVTLTEEQLILIAKCVEDCHRFVCGQTGLDNTISILCSPHKFMIKERLKLLSKFVNPDLLPNQSYDWAGSGCKDKSQKKFIAMTYAIYREILHKVVNAGVYKSHTLTCNEGGTPPRIEKVWEQDDKHKIKVLDYEKYGNDNSWVTFLADGK